MIKHAQIAWQLYCQQRRQPHQWLLTYVQVILMVFITTLSLSSESIQHYLTNNLNSLLGADASLSQLNALAPVHQEQLATLAERIVLTQSLTTTITHNQQWQRVKLKGVGDDYPLQGNIVSTLAIGGKNITSASGPSEHEIWVEARLLSSLNLRLGDTLTVGSIPITVTRILLHEPDRLMEGHNVDMRALIHRTTFEQLGISADVVSHRYLLAASKAQIEHLDAWQKAQLPATQLLHKQGSHPLSLFWQRTENLIGLSSVILFFMATIAIHQLTQVQIKKERFLSAVCMSLGSSKGSVIQISIAKWLIHVMVLVPVAVLLSLGFHWLIVNWLSATFIDLTWQWHGLLAMRSILFTSLLFLMFQLPIWVSLTHTSVAQLCVHTTSKLNNFLMLGCSIVVFVVISITYSDNLLLTSMVLGVTAATILLLLCFSWVSLSVAERMSNRLSGLLAFALYMMKQRLLAKSTQILGVGLCAFLLLFTLMLLRDVGNNMEAYQRQHDGNVLISRANSQQLIDLQAWASQHDIIIQQHKQFVLASLTAVNGINLQAFANTPSDSLATLSRPIRLHWSQQLPLNNRLVKGAWWQTNDPHWQQVSIEQEVMTDLGLQLGDELTFYAANQPITFTIVASHEFKPGAGSITFWAQVPPSAITQISAPHYSMASLELRDDQFKLLATLWQQHPTLRMVPLQEVTSRFDDTLAMVTRVISGFATLIVLLATIVIVASIQAQQAKEKQKNSIILSFGFSRRTCLHLNVIEWVVTGLIAALGAIIGTWSAGALIYQSQFSMHYAPDIWWLLSTLLCIVLAVTVTGVIFSRVSLSSSVRELLQE